MLAMRMLHFSYQKTLSGYSLSISRLQLHFRLRNVFFRSMGTLQINCLKVLKNLLCCFFYSNQPSWEIHGIVLVNLQLKNQIKQKSYVKSRSTYFLKIALWMRLPSNRYKQKPSLCQNPKPASETSFKVFIYTLFFISIRVNQVEAQYT